ncbi:response regulator transcription factor, partial [Algibacter sp.]|nr:response regulator transcription factor [Algibacter sp.]
MIKVVLADDHVLVRDGIKALLEDQKGITVIDEASNGIEALEVINQNKPDILIVDIRMPEMNGIEVVREMSKSYKDVKTLVLSMHDSEEYVVQAIQAGADGYLLKGASKEEFLKALNKVASGGKYFTGDVSAIIMKNFVNGTTTSVTPKQALVETPFKLTKREKQILSLVIQLKNNKDIAEELEISK